jgi:hypothetical protein
VRNIGRIVEGEKIYSDGAEYLVFRENMGLSFVWITRLLRTALIR